MVAAAVVLLIPQDAEASQEGTLLIAGVIPGITAYGSVTHTFDTETRTFSFSRVAWRDEPVGDFFLEGIFASEERRVMHQQEPPQNSIDAVVK